MSVLIYTAGQDVPLAVTALNDSGIPAAASTVVVTVTAPDGSTTTPAIVPAGTGVYAATVPACPSRKLRYWL